MFGGIDGLKYHLARILCKDVVVCDKCPDEVTTEMVVALDAIREQTEKRARHKFEASMIGRSSMGPLDATPKYRGVHIRYCSKKKCNFFFLPSSYNSEISTILGELQ